MRYIIILLLLFFASPACGAEIVKSIKATAGDYSTIAAWEADLDNTGIYSSGDDAIGELYDEVYDETVDIDGGGDVGLASVVLRAASGEEHDGTAGTGARIVMSANNKKVTVDTGTIPADLEFIEIDFNGYYPNTYSAVYFVNQGNPKNLIIHDVSWASHVYALHITNNSQVEQGPLNCIVYDIYQAHGSTGFVYGIYLYSSNNWQRTGANNTVYKVVNDNGTGVAVGIATFYSTAKLRNCISMGAGGTTSGNKKDFDGADDHDYLLSSDDTADDGGGSNCLINKTASDQFVSTADGSEDLHLKSGADAIDAGVDLGITPSGVEIDIDGRDRDAEGDTWDMGADELVSEAPPAFSGAQVI